MMYTSIHPFKVIDPDGLIHQFTMFYENAGDFDDFYCNPDRKNVTNCSCGNTHTWNRMFNIINFGKIKHSPYDFQVCIADVCSLISLRGGSPTHSEVIDKKHKGKEITIITKYFSRLHIKHKLKRKKYNEDEKTCTTIVCSCKKHTDVSADRFCNENEHWVDGCRLVYLEIKKWEVTVCVNNPYFTKERSKNLLSFYND